MIDVTHIVREAEGGMRKHVHQLLRLTDRSKFRLSLAATEGFISSVRSELPPDISCLEVRIGDSVGLTCAPSLPALARLARGKSHSRIVHAHGYAASMVGAVVASLSGAKFVFTAHNVLPDKISRASGMAVRFASRSAVKVIAISESVKRGLESAGVRPEKICLVRNGVEAFHAPDSFSRPVKLAELGLNLDTNVVLCIARFTPVKGIKYLIEAIPALRKSVLDCAVVIAGDGPERAELEDLDSRVNSSNGAVFIGFRTDITELLLAADVVAIPSLQEGLGLVALEAMAAGRPVVASAVGGLAEIIEDGVTGVLVPPANPDALAQELGRVLINQSLATAIASAGRDFVTREMSVDKMITQTEELYKQCAA